MFEEFRQRVPSVLKRPVRKMVDAVDAAAQNRALERCVSALRSRRHSRSVDLDLLSEIRRAWGNEAYSADVDFWRKWRRVFSRGRGRFSSAVAALSTLIAGLLSQCGGGRAGAGQDRVWHEQMTATLRRLT